MTTISNPNTQQNVRGTSADSAYFQSIERAAKAIQEADLIVIGRRFWILNGGRSRLQR